MLNYEKKKKWVLPNNLNRKWVYGLVLALLILNLQSFEPIIDVMYAKEWSMDDVGRNLGGKEGKSVMKRNHSAFKGSSKGYAMCVGDNKPMVTSAMYKIKELRTTWNSTLPMAIAHCHELSEKTIGELRQIHRESIMGLIESSGGNEPVLDIVDLCIDGSVAKKKRLRGFYCKPAALVSSPYVETMLIDTDTIWFQNPDVLFEAPLYKDTGSLFFRDRAMRAPYDNIDGHEFCLQLQFVKKYIQEQSALLQGKYPSLGYQPERFTNWNREVSESLYLNGGHGTMYVWKSDIDVSATAIAHGQESSVVLLDSSRMPRTVRALRDMIPTFSLGYGDKEMYWIAATLAAEEFSFEPFLEGMYGDCGAVFHFDPTSITSDILKAGKIPPALDNQELASAGTHKKYRGAYTGVMPLFLNGQFAAEKVLFLGAMMELEMTRPRLATPNLLVAVMGGHSKRTNGPCGACKIAGGCVDVPSEINKRILSLQEYQLAQTGEPPGYWSRNIKRVWDKFWVKITPAWLD